MSQPTRRSFLRQSSLALGGAALFAHPRVRRALASSAPAESTHVRTAFSWIPASEWGSWYLAEANGDFSANGIDSELLHGGPNTPAVSQIMAGGGAEIGLAADELELINSNAEGSDYVIMAASYQRSPFGYCWLTETPISEPADLVGKRIGGVQGDQIRIDAVFKINGLDVDYEFVPMSFDPQPLVDGEMDLMTCYVTNQPISLRMQGHDVTAVTFSDFGLTTYGDVIFASKKWLDDNRDVAVRYFRGLIAGADALVADPDSMIPIMMENYGADAELDEEFETAANVEFIKLMQNDFTDANGLLAIDLDFVRDSVFPAYVAGGTAVPDIDVLYDVTIAQDAAGVGASMALPAAVASAVARTPLVFGTAPLASGFWGNDEATAVAAAVEGIDRGIAWFDTAPLYGAGESERRLGAALAARAGADVVVSTKVGRPVVIGDGGAEAGFDYSASGTRRSLEDSLARLGRDHVDIVHVHDPDDHLDAALGECFPALGELRAEGVVGAVSVGTMVCATALRVLAEAGPDVVMIANRLTLLDRSALDELAPACAAAGVPLVAAAPFNSGLLARPVPGSWFDYAPADPTLLRRAQAMGARCHDAGVSLRAAALQFPLRHDPVVAVVAGMASAAEVADDVELLAAPIPADLWTALEAI